MGLDTEYSARRVCPVEGCEAEATYVLNVQWSLFDFTEYESCGEHMAFTERYWMARTVDGQEPVITVDFVWP